MEKIIVEKYNQVFVRILCEMSTRLELNEFFSTYIPNRWFNPKVRKKLWDGKIKFFDSKQSLLPIGLLPKLTGFAKEYDYEIDYRLSDYSFVNSISEEVFEKILSSIFEGSRYWPREHQEEAILEALTKKRGLLLLPTSSGKSNIIYALVRYFIACKRKTILIVPSTMLVDQMYNDFREYGWTNIDNHVTKMYSGVKPDYSKDVLITTWQSMIKKDSRLLSQYKCVLIDEVHLAKAKSIGTLCKDLVNADYRIGLTGTLPKDKSDLWTIYGHLGDVIYSKISSELMDAGILSKLVMAMIYLKYPNEICQKMKGRIYAEEVKFVEEYQKRNKVFDFILNSLNEGENTLLLINHIKHIDQVKKYLENKFGDKFKIYEISGRIDVKERNRIKALMEVEKNMIILASYSTMSTGVSIKRIHHVILGSSSRAKIRVLQTIGRGLRLHPEKSKVLIWDISDDLSVKTRNGTDALNHLMTHSVERYSYYEEQKFICHSKVINLE